MKIRIKGNSIRYRMSKSDIEAFLKLGYIEETVDFGAQKLTYALEKHEEPQIKAIFVQNTITLFMPTHMAEQWQQPEKIGFNGLHGNLSLLIEKDFQCLDNTLEDQSDNYANPALVC